MSKKPHSRRVVTVGGKKVYVNPLKSHKEILWERQNGRCWICGEQMIKTAMKNSDGSHDDMHATIDHLRTQADGGSDDISNLALAHYKCNCLRGRNNFQGLGKQLVASEQKVFNLQQQVTALEKKRHNQQSLSSQQTNTANLLRSQRDQALAALQILRAAPPRPCAGIACRTIRGLRRWLSIYIVRNVASQQHTEQHT